jgi:putative NADPH-quinone reductase
MQVIFVFAHPENLSFTRFTLTQYLIYYRMQVIFVFAHPENPSFTRKVLDSLDFAFPRAKKVLLRRYKGAIKALLRLY